MTDQLGLFGGPRLPEGFRYQPDLISPDEERELLDHIRALPFKPFEFHGYTGRRQVVSYGWKYDFSERKLERREDIPPFLLPLRERAAAFAGLPPSELQHALVTEYEVGAPIGWHKDKAVFGDVIGVSLLSGAPFRLRRQAGGKWERVTITAEPRSVYLLRGPSRTEWEHSIPPVEHLRYSVTFRNFASIPPAD
jgi:alkylated DNA repair dioxygenase AlkB